MQLWAELDILKILEMIKETSTEYRHSQTNKCKGFRVVQKIKTSKEFRFNRMIQLTAKYITGNKFLFVQLFIEG